MMMNDDRRADRIVAVTILAASILAVLVVVAL